jgi:hypothetical protein
VNALARTVIQIKDISEQPEGQFTVIEADTHGSLSCEDYFVREGWLEGNDKDGNVVFAGPASNFKIYSNKVTNRMTREESSREIALAEKAQADLERALESEHFPDRAEDRKKQEAMMAALMGGPASGGTVQFPVEEKHPGNYL